MRALPILILLVASACSSPFGGGNGRPVLVNQTENPVLYNAVDLADGPLVDPAPTLDPAVAPERLVASGAQQTVDVDQHSGEGVLLFLYELPSQDHAGPVPLSRIVPVPQGELVRMHGRILIGEE